MNSESTLSDALSEVDTALEASDNERAASLASELLLAYPNAIAVLRARARALSAAGRSLQAAEVHRRVLEMLPADGDAMAGLARALHLAGQHAEARDAARQALDYLPRDILLSRIASDGQLFDPDPVSMQFVKARTDSLAGMTQRAAAGLRNVIIKSPDRTDAKIVLMQTLWRKGARIAAAEQAQAVLDEYAYCLNAHLLMLELWRTAGASDMERVHLQVIDQVDPDHRVTHAMFGAQSPLPLKDVPARPAQPTEPVAAEEDALAREAWVESLVAASSALPRPLEQSTMPAAEAANAADDDSVANIAAESDEPSEFISSLLPLEWSAAGDLSEDAAQDDFGVSWIDGNVKDAFAPARPRAAQPDPNDGVPAELPALEWEGEGDEGAAQKDFRTTLDGGSANDAESPSEKREAPLKPLAAAGAVAQAVPTQPTPEQTPPAATHTAPLESAPQQNVTDAQATQAMAAEVESSAIKPMPIDAVEFVDEDVERWDAGEGFQEGIAVRDVQPDATPIPATASAVETTAQPEVVPIAPPTPAQPDASGAPVMKAAATATALGVASKKRKPRADATTTPDTQPPEAPIAAPEQAPAATMDVASEPATLAPVVSLTPPDAMQDEPEPEAIAPAEKARAKKAPASKATRSKPAKKPAARPTNYEAQTEKVRKTYERAIVTAKRDDLPKLIKELNQAAERDPDNKIIFELLGQAYNRSGDIPAAINAYRKALELAE